MVVVRLAHAAQLAQVVDQCIAVARRHVVVIHHELDTSDSMIPFAFIEAATIPLAREIAQLPLRRVIGRDPGAP